MNHSNNPLNVVNATEANSACCQNDQGSIQHEEAVANRYSKAAEAKEGSLCCPVNYQSQYLEVIPQEIIERDYGCGDPSAYVGKGETVVDLGSGGGKLCYIAAQVVGPEGSVIGVDCNLDMLNLARSYQQEVADKVGYDVVSFRCGVIQNLALDLELLEQEITKLSTQGIANLLDRRRLEQRLEKENPMIKNDSVDCVMSNCVLNLVRPKDRIQLFQEIYRVLKRGGRAVISDIVSDETVPDAMKNDSELWSGCISGAWREDQFVKAFEDAGFYGIEIAKRETTPWRTVNGIEFRSVTLVAYKGKDGVCLERNQAMIYRGPFQEVVDDNNQVFVRGQRTAVCDKTFTMAQKPPYSDSFYLVPPREEIPLESAETFDCTTNSIRDPRQTKGLDFHESSCCEEDRCC